MEESVGRLLCHSHWPGPPSPTPAYLLPLACSPPQQSLPRGKKASGLSVSLPHLPQPQQDAPGGHDQE